MRLRMNIGLTYSAMLLAISLGASGAGTERYPWLTDLDQARELAASKEMPLLIVFRCEP